MATVTIPAHVVEKLRKLRELREEQDSVSRKVNKFHERLQTTTREKAERYSEKLWLKLKEYYCKLKALAEQEERLCVECAAEIEALDLAEKGGPGPKKKGNGDLRKGRGAPGTGEGHIPGGLSRHGHGHAAPKSVAAVGDMVAARTSSADAEKDDWIVVKVLGFDPTLQKYKVIDEEPGEEEGAGPKKFELDASCILPFPRAADPPPAPSFPPGCHVLAVYPGTTSLYRATVALGAPPRKGKDDDYFLEFDDDEEEGVEGLPKRRVPFFHVVPLPKGHRQ